MENTDKNCTKIAFENRPLEKTNIQENMEKLRQEINNLRKEIEKIIKFK